MALKKQKKNRKYISKYKKKSLLNLKELNLQIKRGFKFEKTMTAN